MNEDDLKQKIKHLAILGCALHSHLHAYDDAYTKGEKAKREWALRYNISRKIYLNAFREFALKNFKDVSGNTISEEDYQKAIQPGVVCGLENHDVFAFISPQVDCLLWNSIMTLREDSGLKSRLASEIKEDIAKQLLIEGLQSYINRVESHTAGKGVAFDYGFKFAKSFQSANREANYKLAQSLKDELSDPNSDIKTVLKSINARRKDCVQQIDGFKGFGIFANHGKINSRELNSVINTATAGLKLF